MIPTDNKSPRVSELIEELKKHDPDLRVLLGVRVGCGPINVKRIEIEEGTVVLEIVQ